MSQQVPNQFTAIDTLYANEHIFLIDTAQTLTGSSPFVTLCEPSLATLVEIGMSVFLIHWILVKWDCLLFWCMQWKRPVQVYETSVHYIDFEHFRRVNASGWREGGDQTCKQSSGLGKNWDEENYTIQRSIIERICKLGKVIWILQKRKVCGFFEAENYLSFFSSFVFMMNLSSNKSIAFGVSEREMENGLIPDSMLSNSIHPLLPLPFQLNRPL